MKCVVACIVVFMDRRATRIAAWDLLPDLPWEPRVYLGRVPRALRRHRAEHLRLGTACESVFEGTRSGGGTEESSGTVYRQADLRPFEIVPDRALQRRQSRASSVLRSRRQALLRGDVVVNKLSPVRAALVCDSTAGSPVDWSCLVVRGLEPCHAVWLAACLNRDEYADHLFAMSGGAVLRRIGLKALRGLRLPPPPSGSETLAQELFDAVAERSHLRESVRALLQQVERAISDLLPSDVGDDSGSHTQGGRWSRRVRPTAFGDSWVPDHVLAGSVTDRLHREFRWKRATRFLVPGSFDRTRMSSHTASRVRLLRLRDADEGVFTPLLTQEEQPSIPARVYGRPLQSGEVLLSGLATSPSVVFAWGQAIAHVHPVDHWERLRFSETPGAFALILACPSVQRQFQQLTSGMTRQFLRPEAVRDLLLPPIDYEVRRQWHTALLTLADLWDRGLSKWRDLQERADRFFRQQHPGEAT